MCRVVFVACLWTAGLASAAAAEDVTPSSATGVKRALIVCGLSGDEERHRQFAETTGRLWDGLHRIGFEASDIDILFGDEPTEGDPESVRNSSRSTREEITQRVQALRERMRPEDVVWVIVLGHAHYDGRQVWLNLPGPDLNHLEFARLFEGVAAREQVFVITTPTSGFFIKPLAAKGRVVMTATEADWETNETEFPHEFARVLVSIGGEESLDIDTDGRVSLYDLYIVVARNLAQSYLERELLATEHALLDDDADGRGTELQIDFLTVDQGGRRQPNRPLIPPVITRGDGVLSKSLILPQPR